MTDRAAVITRFLAGAGWQRAHQIPLAGDASTRRYLRLADGGRRAILMDADPQSAGPVQPFLNVGLWLGAEGYSAPGILAADPAEGLVLLEDLGDDLFARRVEADAADELPLYLAATALLADLHTKRPPAFLPPGDAPALGTLVSILPDWYLAGMDAPAVGIGQRLAAEVTDLLDRLAGGPGVVALRDFHAENLVWLPARAGLARVGLLDFQDAFVSHPAYDLASLLQDARRDVTPATVRAARDHFLTLSGADAEPFTAACAIVGAQRALRILAVFARLCMAGGKPGYLRLMPRVWRDLQGNLVHPALAGLARTIEGTLPAPTPARLERIRKKCGKIPMR